MPLSVTVDNGGSGNRLSSILHATGWILTGFGATLTIVGLVMIPLPGPGFLMLFAGAAILAADVAIRMFRRVSQR